jgi:hypothetical protein
LPAPPLPPPGAAFSPAAAMASASPRGVNRATPTAGPTNCPAAVSSPGRPKPRLEVPRAAAMAAAAAASAAPPLGLPSSPLTLAADGPVSCRSDEADAPAAATGAVAPAAHAGTGEADLAAAAAEVGTVAFPFPRVGLRAVAVPPGAGTSFCGTAFSARWLGAEFELVSDPVAAAAGTASVTPFPYPSASEARPPHSEPAGNGVANADAAAWGLRSVCSPSTISACEARGRQSQITVN